MELALNLTRLLVRSPKNAKRLLELRPRHATRSLQGIGNPKPFKYLRSDVWSRRITQKHRRVYLVKADRIEFLQGRYHHYLWLGGNTGPNRHFLD